MKNAESVAHNDLLRIIFASTEVSIPFVVDSFSRFFWFCGKLNRKKMAALVEVVTAGGCLGQQHQNLKPVVLSTQWAGLPMKKNKKMVSPGRKLGQWCLEGDLAFLASSGFRVKKPWISSVFVRAASPSSSFSQLVSQAQEPLAGTGGT
jgi:hypothetical protein